MKQQTIKNEVRLEGKGLHTGALVKMTLKAAEANHGIKFKRVDLDPELIIPADVSLVVETNRGTVLEKSGQQLRTVEHILSALSGLQIDNLLIELDGPEIPILDGSAQVFVNAIRTAGIQKLDKEREYFRVEEAFQFKDENTGSEYQVFPSDKFEVSSLIDFSGTPVDKQFAHLSDLSDYVEEIAPSRTFVFASEIEQLYNNGLVKGGDLKNALIIVDEDIPEEKIHQLAKLFGFEEIKIQDGKVLNNAQPSCPNEPARHKLLDILGDLALVGKPVLARISAFKPGHSSNIEFARILKQKYQEQKRLKGKPKYDPDKEPIFDAVGVQNFLPHRYPFLLVDKIIELSESQVVGIKNISFNEGFFQGHFPGNPIFPGVLQMEALAQTGGILALNNVDNAQEWDTYFLKMENVRFKKKVVPGDTLILKMELLSPIRRGIVHMQGTAYVGNNIVSEGELTAQIVHNPPSQP